MSLILLCLLIAVYFDIALFKLQNDGAFRRTFVLSRVWIVSSLILTVAVVFLSDDVTGDLPELLLLLVMPVYLLQRSRYVKSVVWEPAQEVPALLSSALGVIIIWMYGAVTFGLFTSAVMTITDGGLSEMGDLVLSAVFSSFLIMALVYQSSRRFSDKGFLVNIGLRAKGVSRSRTILIPVVLGLAFAAVSAYFGMSRPVQPETPLGDVLNATQSFSLIAVFLFLAIVTAPFVEEVVFRGYFFHVLRRWIGVRNAVIIIALIFAVLHVGQYWGDWLAIVMVAVLGFVLTWLRAWTGSTLASVIMHYVYNGSVTLLPIIILSATNPAYLEYRTYYPYHDAPTKEALLKESIVRQPDLADAYNDLAWLYAEEGENLPEALELVDKALSYAPEYKAYLDTKAAVLEEMGRYPEARDIRDAIDWQ